MPMPLLLQVVIGNSNGLVVKKGRSIVSGPFHFARIQLRSATEPVCRFAQKGEMFMSGGPFLSPKS
jgi:hypothetical protein